MSTTNQSLIRLPEVLKRTGFGKAWIYRLISEGRFPAPLRSVFVPLLLSRVKLTSGFNQLSNQAELMLLN